MKKWAFPKTEQNSWIPWKENKSKNGFPNRKRNSILLSSTTGVNIENLEQRKKKQDGELVSFQYELYDFDLQKFYEKPKIYKDAPLGKFEELDAIEDAVRYLNPDEETTLLVPSVLAYGTYGDGDQIPYDMPLIIKLKLTK